MFYPSEQFNQLGAGCRRRKHVYRNGKFCKKNLKVCRPYSFSRYSLHSVHWKVICWIFLLNLTVKLQTWPMAHISYQRSSESIPEFGSTEFWVRPSSRRGEIFDAAKAVMVLKHVLKQFLLKLVVLFHGVKSRFDFLCWRFFRRRLVPLNTL